MEGIILIIILGIISSIFNKLGDKEVKKGMPTFGGGKPIQTKPIKRKFLEPKTYSLEDLTKEIFHPQKENTKPYIEKIEEKTTSNTNNVEFSKTNRINVNQQEKPAIQSKKQVEVSVVPTSKEALVQAIISSEILGPPMAKRR